MMKFSTVTSEMGIMISFRDSYSAKNNKISEKNITENKKLNPAKSIKLKTFNNQFQELKVKIAHSIFCPNKSLDCFKAEVFLATQMIYFEIL